MEATAVYKRGETIGIYFEGDANHDIEVNTFTVSIINKSAIQNTIEIQKSMCTKIEDNKYYYEISNTTTKAMREGSYDIEVLIGDDYTLIPSRVGAIKIENSYSKKFVQ